VFSWKHHAGVDREHPNALNSDRPGKRTLSLPFVGLLAVVGTIGVAAPAFAGSNSQGPSIYYSTTGVGGVIECAGTYASVSAGGGNVTITGWTYVKKDLYCADYDSHPANYFSVNVVLINGSDLICEQTPVVWNNSSEPSLVTATNNWAESQCSSSGYFAETFSHAAVNFGWHDGQIITTFVSP
jgi:hypothetical protein